MIKSKRVNRNCETYDQQRLTSSVRGWHKSRNKQWRREKKSCLLCKFSNKWLKIKRNDLDVFTSFFADLRHWNETITECAVYTAFIVHLSSCFHAVIMHHIRRQTMVTLLTQEKRSATSGSCHGRQQRTQRNWLGHDSSLAIEINNGSLLLFICPCVRVRVWIGSWVWPKCSVLGHAPARMGVLCCNNSLHTRQTSN